MTRLPSLSALRAFEAVGRTGSLRAAGEELGISPTVVSRHLHNLQADLGVDLVGPQGRGVVLTDDGRRFHATLSQGFDLVRRAVEEARPRARDSLVIWCIPGLANRRLLPRLPDLQQRLGTLEVVLQPTLSRPDFDRGEADAEIVYLPAFEPMPRLRAERLAEPAVHAVASPAFVARYRITRAEDLLGLPLVHEESTRQWEDWLRAQGVAEVPPLKGPRLWHAHLAIEAARLGQGVALANGLLVEDDLVAGRLVDVVPPSPPMGAYHLVGPAGHWRDRAMVRLRSWLRDVLGPSTTDALPASVGRTS